MQILLEYEWPGNIRELKNIIMSSVFFTEDIILPQHLQIEKISQSEKADKLVDFYSEDFSLKEAAKNAVREVEKKYITQALILAKSNRVHASKKLKI